MKYRGTRIERTLRYVYLRFVRLHGTAKDVARGLALGVFIGMTPTMGIQTPLALLGAMLLKENKIAALIGVWVSNPMTFIPIYTFNFKVGKYILGTSALQMPKFTSIHEVLELGHDFIMPLILGSFIVAIITAVISYFIFLYVFTAIKLEKDKIKQHRALKRAMGSASENEENDHRS
ncbi:MAG: DUF2062 domain-containing protein [Proteobacteria bacterium]|nr:DUF2062 domain-containing protein [Pseudomonadota bacterium]